MSWYLNFKRFLDFLVAFSTLIFLSPLFLSLMIALSLTNRWGIFFLQERPGRQGKIFKVIKFKTMRDFDPAEGLDIHSPKRTTELGRFVRKYSLDEIPQLINVIKGDMSLVGPRPLLVKYLPLYNDFQRRRHEVRPGITGWAQVNGRNSISWEERFNFDIWYVEHISFITDFKILYRTIIKLFHKQDVNSSEEMTMPEFTGNFN